MFEDSPSRTALVTAFLRALHLHIDDAPPILDDRVALRLLPGLPRGYIQRLSLLPTTRLRRYRRRFDAVAQMRAQIVVRSRYAEDALGHDDARPAARFVILGAGLDTFACRQPAQRIPVLEIDHPATQRWKRRLLTQSGIGVPEALEFAPVNFERDSLDDAWPASNAPDFVSWLGTTYYLTRDAIRDTLATIAARTQPGTRLVLDYWSGRPASVGGNLLLWGTRLAVALQNEPIVSLFEPREIEALARGAGWKVLDNADPEAQRARYMAGRADGLRVPDFAHLLHLARD